MSLCLEASSAAHQMQQSVEKCKQQILHQLHCRSAQHHHVAAYVTAFVFFVAQLDRPRNVKVFLPDA